MIQISLDYETYSECDLVKSGANKYATHHTTELLCAAYAIYDITNPQDILKVTFDDVKVFSYYHDKQFPLELINAINSGATINAFNANFERLITKHVLGYQIPLNRYNDVGADALYAGLSGTLAAIGDQLNIRELKMAEGKDLISMFCVPKKPTKNDSRTRLLPDDSTYYEQLMLYCRRDVWAEIQIQQTLVRKSLRPAYEKMVQQIDWVINDNGMLIDIPYVKKVLEHGKHLKETTLRLAEQEFGIDNIGSNQQCIKKLKELGLVVHSINKDYLETQSAKINENPRAKRFLELRSLASLSSIAKYKTILEVVKEDNRIRDCIKYYGAHTGRYAGRLVQPHNLPKGLEDANEIRKIKRDLLSGNTANITQTELKNTIRSAIIAPPGQVLCAVDFSAIEGRVIAWLANEKWRLDVFSTHGKVYEASAAQMFNIPIETIVKGHENYSYRALGKVSELALGYQGSVGAIRQMDGKGELSHMNDMEVKNLVNAWRDASPNIVKLWNGLDRMCIDALALGTVQTYGKFRAYPLDGDLVVELPSGRVITYHRAKLGQNQWGNASVMYKGLDDKNKWVWKDTYGGKFVENVTQALARDILVYSIVNLFNAGYKIVCHVHDEIVVECDPGHQQRITDIMKTLPSWCSDMPINAEGQELEFYKK